VNAFDVYSAQVNVYNAQIQAYVDKLVRQAMETQEQILFDTLSNPAYLHPSKKGKTMADRIEVFTVYAAANGYYAELAIGKLVIGATLSECCTAAQAAMAEHKIAGDEYDGPTAADPLNQRNALWNKVRPLTVEERNEMLNAVQPSLFLSLFSGKPPKLCETPTGKRIASMVKFNR
jgi:hypothetical protein